MSTNNPIPFIDFQAQQEKIQVSLQKRINTVLNNNQYILGPEVGELELKLAEYVGVKHCIAVANGTDALMIALMALDVKQGDEVITPPFTFIATAETIAILGAIPIFVDIDPKTYNLDPDLLEQAITPKTKAIIPVSLFGQCADFDKMNDIAGKYGIPVIEDAAQSFGATHKGRKSGNLSAIACASFFPTKPLGCYGDGGACFTNHDDLAVKMRQISRHGQDRHYHHILLGVNSRLDTLQAAVLLAKFEVFPEEIEARVKVANRYTEFLKDIVTTPYIESHNTCVYAQYTIQVDNREKVQERLKAAGIPTTVHYPIPLHLQPAFAYLNLPEGSFPVAEAVANKVLSLPMHPYLSEKQQDFIIDKLKEIVNSMI
jgi:UDP-2-acetamido-2-deoxy-ribo-hexuluronate aminotransferase